MGRELVDALKREIAEAEARLTWLKETLRKANGMKATVPAGVSTGEGELIRPSVTSAKVADVIERILEYGKKTIKRDALIKLMADEKLVGGTTEARRRQYADMAIDFGIEANKPYIKEDRDGTIHWIPDVRKSRVSKKR